MADRERDLTLEILHSTIEMLPIEVKKEPVDDDLEAVVQSGTLEADCAKVKEERDEHETQAKIQDGIQVTKCLTLKVELSGDDIEFSKHTEIQHPEENGVRLPALKEVGSIDVKEEGIQDFQCTPLSDINENIIVENELDEECMGDSDQDLGYGGCPIELCDLVYGEEDEQVPGIAGGAAHGVSMPDGSECKNAVQETALNMNLQYLSAATNVYDSKISKWHCAENSIYEYNYCYPGIRWKNTRSGPSQVDMSCNLCPQVFSTKENLIKHAFKHINRMTPPGQLCRGCGKVFPSLSSLIGHLRTDRSGDCSAAVVQLSSDKPYSCNICRNTFISEIDLKNHVEEHKNTWVSANISGDTRGSSLGQDSGTPSQSPQHRYKCDLCGKTYKWNQSLTIHKRLHIGEQPYCCEICGESFARSEYLNVHTRTHTGEQPHTCHICGKSYKWAHSLRKHFRIHTGERPYVCDVCGKSFSARDYYKIHLRLHEGSLPYACGTCGKSFAQVCGLTAHARSHTGERPYVCDICGRAFCRSGNLRIHTRLHAREHPYACSKCGELFARCDTGKTHRCAHEKRSEPETVTSVEDLAVEPNT